MAELLLQVSQRRFWNGLAARDQHDIGSPESSQRLSKESSWQEVAVTERIQGIDQHEIEVPMDPAVLERIVEDNRTTLMFQDQPAGARNAVGLLHMRHSRTQQVEHPQLVVPGMIQ